VILIAPNEGCLAENVLSGLSPVLFARCCMQDIFWGVAIIAIGLFMGGSIFLGQFTILNFIFDGLGIFFLGKGAIGMIGQKSEN
jgi:hypothetical protein